MSNSIENPQYYALCLLRGFLTMRIAFVDLNPLEQKIRGLSAYVDFTGMNTTQYIYIDKVTKSSNVERKIKTIYEEIYTNGTNSKNFEQNISKNIELIYKYFPSEASVKSFIEKSIPSISRRHRRETSKYEN